MCLGLVYRIDAALILVQIRLLDARQRRMDGRIGARRLVVLHDEQGQGMTWVRGSVDQNSIDAFYITDSGRTAASDFGVGREPAEALFPCKSPQPDTRS